LLEALRVEPPHDCAWRLTVARNICVAVVALHNLGRYHGSLAPRNFWVAENGDVYVMEAGLVDALLKVGVLHDHDLLACLGLEFARYMAPEGWQVPRRGGASADVWALGLVLLEVLGGAGSPNRDCPTLRQLSAKLLPKRGIYKPQVNIAGPIGSLPKVAQCAILSCFNEDPNARPTAQDLLFSLAAPSEGIRHEMLEASSTQRQPEEALGGTREATASLQSSSQLMTHCEEMPSQHSRKCLHEETPQVNITEQCQGQILSEIEGGADASSTLWSQVATPVELIIPGCTSTSPGPNMRWISAQNEELASQHAAKSFEPSLGPTLGLEESQNQPSQDMVPLKHKSPNKQGRRSRKPPERADSRPLPPPPPASNGGVPEPRPPEPPTASPQRCSRQRPHEVGMPVSRPSESRPLPPEPPPPEPPMRVEGRMLPAAEVATAHSRRRKPPSPEPPPPEPPPPKPQEATTDSSAPQARRNSGMPCLREEYRVEPPPPEPPRPICGPVPIPIEVVRCCAPLHVEPASAAPRSGSRLRKSLRSQVPLPPPPPPPEGAEAAPAVDPKLLPKPVLPTPSLLGQMRMPSFRWARA